MQQKFYSFASACLMPPLQLTSRQKTPRIVRCRYRAKILFRIELLHPYFYFNRCIELYSIDLTRKKCGTKAFYICVSRKNKQAMNKITFDSSQIFVIQQLSFSLFMAFTWVSLLPRFVHFQSKCIVCLIE